MIHRTKRLTCVDWTPPLLFYILRKSECLKYLQFYNNRAKIANIESTENAKQKLLIEKMRKKDHEVSAFVPTNMAANFVQHNRCKIIVFKDMILCSHYQNAY